MKNNFKRKRRFYSKFKDNSKIFRILSLDFSKSLIKYSLIKEGVS